MGGEGEIGEIVYAVTTWLLPVLFAITLHEAAHGYVAWKLGDDTAYRLGRVSFNPLRHIDRFGTIILPGLLLLMRAPFLFGWAKPVPVNFSRLNNPRRDMVLVAAAGPAINLAMAVGAAVFLHGAVLLPPEVAAWTVENLK
ncbi:MAG: site-2 protease family protein, partial [Rhodospirillaceae bacterium]|nr:site-2 protease family protein [Rhodospirillaceae bacterium]